MTDSSDFKSAKLFKVQYLGKAAHFISSFQQIENLFREKVEFCIGMKLSDLLPKERTEDKFLDDSTILLGSNLCI